MSDTNNKQMQTVFVEGTGESKAEAFSSALNKIQKKVLKETSDVILRIEPMDVSIVTAQEQSYKEKFLFFFMSRKRVKYHVELNVKVELTMIEVDKVEFDKKSIQDPNGMLNFNYKKI